MTPVIVAGLAAARLTRAWLHETVGEWPRQRIERWAQPRYEVRGDEFEIVDSARTFIVKGYVDELVGCPHCIGFWFALVCVVGYRFRPARPLVVALAASTIVSAAADHYPGFDHTEPDDD